MYIITYIISTYIYNDAGISCIVFIIFIQTSSHEQVNFLVAPSSEGALSTVTLLKPLSATLCLGDQRSDSLWGSQGDWIPESPKSKSRDESKTKLKWTEFCFIKLSTKKSSCGEYRQVIL